MKKARSFLIYALLTLVTLIGICIAAGAPMQADTQAGDQVTAIEAETVNDLSETPHTTELNAGRNVQAPVLVPEEGQQEPEEQERSEAGGGVEGEEGRRENGNTEGHRENGNKTAEKAEAPPAKRDSKTVYLDNLTAPLKTMTAENGEIDPPDRGENVWLITDYAEPSETGSRNVYLVAHSGYSGRAVGDLLTDTKSKKSKLNNGDIITVKNVSYRVTKQENHSKKNPEKMKSVWANPAEGDPQQLRFITCLQRPGQGKSVELVVVFAERV